MAMNRGEWSEFYTILSLLTEPRMKIVDESFKLITQDLYEVKKLTVQEQTTIIDYILNDNANVSIYFNDEFQSMISNSTLKASQIAMLNNIINAVAGEGAFQISNIESLLKQMSPTNMLKSKSSSKDDLQAIVLDNSLGSNVSLKYSIKSSLGSPATILNASSHTNFIYEVDGIKLNDITVINKIKTKTKLIDRIKKIKQLGGKIKFKNVECENFNYNLKLIDTNMPEYLGNVLLKSYEYKNKNLKELFLNSNDFDDQDFALKKLGDLLESISFGFFPSIKWNGDNNVNGGLIVVKKDGQVVILDLVYFKNSVRKYLIEQTKLDSPSSSRYHMLELFVENGKIYFKLNLQIRYKS